MSLRRRRCWSRWFSKENSGCHSPARISTFIYHKQTYTMLFSYSKWGKINHIVNNAGFTFDKMLHTTSDDTFDIILKIHVRAPFRLIRQAAPYFRLKVCPSKPIFILLSPSILLFEPSLNNVRTAQLSMYPRLPVCTEMSDKPTIPPLRPPW